MAFTYDVKKPENIADDLGFSSLRPGASLYCNDKQEAHTIAHKFNLWAFETRGTLRASVLASSITEGRKRHGWRVWIDKNTDGVVGLGMIDEFTEWVRERILKSIEQPAGGWKHTSELYNDFTTWAMHNGFTKAYLPPINTFSHRLKSNPIGVRLKRLSTGTVATGVKITNAPLLPAINTVEEI